MNKNYHQMYPVVFGCGTLNDLAEHVHSFHSTRAMCICDPGILNTGIIDKIHELLNKNNIKMQVFSDVIPDAPDSMVNKAGAYAVSFHADIIIGIGGGSSMDTAKAVSILSSNPGPISNYYPGTGNTYETNVPLILIPTSSGTGSEVTNLCVIHDEAMDAKAPVYRSANLAIVDPELTLTAPPSVTAASAFDAMSHALEAYTSNMHTQKTDTLALEALQRINKYIIIAFQDGSNMEARENLSFASNIAGIAFNDASVHIGHAIGHELGLQFHLTHGVACALALAEVLHYASDVYPDRIIQAALALGMPQTDQTTPEEAERYAVSQIHSLMRATNIPSLKDLGISRKDVLACWKGAIEKNGFLGAAPKKITPERMQQSLLNVYEGY